jgi:Holliday junction resolvasome RuvABC endonuclease subunit
MSFEGSRFIGIDPGLAKGKLGLSVLYQSTDPLRNYIVESYGVDVIKGMNGTVADTLRCEQLRKYVCGWLLKFSDRPILIGGACVNAPVIAIEAPAFSRQPTRTIQTGMVHYALCKAVLSLKYAYIVVVPPTVLKKYVTGKGNANKELMMESVIRKWFSGSVPFFGSQDLYEAYALAEFGRFLSRTKDKKVKASVEAFKVERFDVSPCEL